ncbi:MAG: hypothetical protein QOK37_278 [Thermoanaerobaculia bacterium]|jgi:hypothetical protein|nr:hypothetical protein [Thermoanaerobaculia bacterium]
MLYHNKAHSDDMADIPPVTFDPRQARIYEQLVRLGPVTAAYFADACRMFQDLVPLESAGAVAAHLLRELKGSVKDVLYPDEKKDQKKKKKEAKKAGGSGAEDKKDSDRRAIVTIAERYGLPSDHEAIELWSNLRLDKFAHRGGLGSAPQLTDVRRAWDELQIVLSVLLDALDSAYTVIYQRIDQLVAIAEPTEDDLNELLQKIPHNPNTLGYFFSKVNGRGWFDRLRGSSMFDRPPAGGYWPQAQYLQRVAAEYPDEVAPILENAAETWSYFTQHQILEALQSLAPAAAGRIVKVIAKSVMTATGHDTFLADDLAKRTATIGKTEPEAALAVFATLLALKPEAEEPRGGYFGARELKSPLEYHTYSGIVGEPLHVMTEAAPRKTLDMLLTVLDEALAAVYTKAKSDDSSKGWMPAIEPHEQNDYHYEPLPRLAEAVRDAAEAAITADPATLQTITDELQARGWQSLERLRLHLLAKFGDPCDPFVQAAVLDEEQFFDYDLRHEYGALVRCLFPALRAEEQARLIAWIKEGPRDVPEQLDQEDREYLRKSWAHLRLSWIREHLTGEDLARLEELDGEFGASEESAEFSGFMSGGVWGPTSPKNDDELKALTVPELVEYLHKWQPSGEHQFARFSPTREGLARQLQPIVKTRALEFAAAAESFIGLDPTYVRVIIAGLEDAVKENVCMDWRSALALCAWAVEQERAIPGRNQKGFDDDPDWSWTWAAIARLLRSGFLAKDDAALPIALREMVWRVLAPITNDPDPDTEREKEDRDPYSVAINSTRGVAMEAVMRYAMWVRQGYWLPEGVTGFSDMPEVEEVVTLHLDPDVDVSRAIRAVYGEFLFALFRMSREWFTKHVDDLFPTERPDLADAVLHAYLAWGRWMTPEFNAVMAPEFQRAIAAFPAASADEEKTPAHVSNVGQRVVAMYMHEEIELTEDSLVARFFALADEKTRAHVISLVPSFVDHADQGDRPKMLERAIAFWQWRLATSSDTDLRGFGRWMESDHFDAAWRLAQLRQVLERVGIVNMDYQIVGTLGGFATDFPAETLHCVRLLVGAGMDGMKVHALMYRGDLRKILRAALASEDDELRKEAAAFANKLVARGFNQFRDVLDPNSQPPTDSDEE